MDEVKPIKLPLSATASRCLGHGDKRGEWCKRSNECARNLTISHANEPWAEANAPYYRMCSNDYFLCFLEVEND